METGMRPHTHVHLRFVGDKACAHEDCCCPAVLHTFSFVLFTFAPRMSEAASTIICGHRLYWLIGGL